MMFTTGKAILYYNCNQFRGRSEQGGNHKDNNMPSFLKSDLTYSLSGGFLLGALALFFMQPNEDQQDFSQNFSSPVTSASQAIG